MPNSRSAPRDGTHSLSNGGTKTNKPACPYEERQRQGFVIQDIGDPLRGSPHDSHSPPCSCALKMHTSMGGRLVRLSEHLKSPMSASRSPPSHPSSPRLVYAYSLPSFLAARPLDTATDAHRAAWEDEQPPPRGTPPLWPRALPCSPCAHNRFVPPGRWYRGCFVLFRVRMPYSEATRTARTLRPSERV